jgi:hypothetical protein
MCVEKGVDLLWEEVLLKGAEELFGLDQAQPERLDALRALVQGNDNGDGFFMTFIVTDDELQFAAHRGASPGSRAGEGIESFYASCLISPSISMLSSCEAPLPPPPASLSTVP